MIDPSVEIALEASILRAGGHDLGNPTSAVVGDGFGGYVEHFQHGDIDWSRFEGIKTLGITAGASAPEVIVEEIMGAFAERYTLHVETVSAAEENEFFPLPRSLRPDAAE